MGNSEKPKKFKKRTILYCVTVFILLGLSIGFLIAFIVERNKNDESQSDTTDSSIGTTSPTIPPITPTTTPPPNLLLPRSVLPTHYDLTVEPKHDIDQFNGIVKIQLNVTEATDVINIHSYNLSVTNQEVFDPSGTSLEIDDFSYDRQKQFNIIKLKNQMDVKNGYQLSLSFNGSFVGIIGFYKSNYTNSDNQIRNFSATKFEPTYARQAFPCFDEPNMKATYNISIIHDKNLNAISNGEQYDQQVIDDSRVQTYFSETVKMSTYLVAYVVSEFQYTESSTTRGRKVRVFSRPDELDKTRYALVTAIKVLEYYENYFEIDYPLEKLDLVALPVFVSGAMENWGLITFRETNLLYSEQESSTNEMKRVNAVIAHEVSHMWFGNLVTMDWWDDLWLNEGFASYIEYRGENSTEPDWNINEFFLNDDMHGVLKLDALESSHPIIQEVTNPDQITEIFDSISYSKGASVIRMLEYAIGTDVFRDGIRGYLNKFQYLNARTQDLWNEIQKVLDNNSGIIKNVTQFMDPWTRVKGYPVVNITRVSSTQITVSQQRFLTNPEEDNNNESYLWPIYLTYFSANVSGNYLLNTKTETITLNNEIPLDSWVKFNDEETGFYVVNYQENDWNLLINTLKSNPEDLSPMNRANIIFDASILAERGFVSYELLFDLLTYVRNEDNLIPWMAAYSSLNRLNSILSVSNGGLSMKQIIKDLSQNLYNSLGWEYRARDVESFEDKLLRGRIISLACNSGNQECLDESLRLFKNWINNDGQQISPDIREYAYKYGMQVSGNDEEWNQLWNLWRTEVSASEKTKLLTGLTSVTNSQLLSKLISYSTNPSLVNDQDFFTVQQSIAGNSIIGRQLVWNYLRDNWDDLVQRFTLNDRRLGTYISSVCSGFATETQLKEMTDFFDKNPDSGAGVNARNQALENVRNNIKWLNTHEDNVTNWLDSNSQSSNPWLNWRLDSQIIPLRYKIEWNVDLNNDQLSGIVSIEVNVTKPINYFILHNNGLQITKAEAYTNGTDQLISSRISPFTYTPNEFCVLPTNETIRPAIYRLYFEFNRNLTTGLDGIYKSTYINSNNESISLATSQFESTYARKAFPCFDEPQFKSTFEISVTHSSGLKALSNMPSVDIIDISRNITVTKFKESVKMVTYLGALVVSDFVCDESLSDPRVQVCAAPDHRAKMNYSLDITPKVLGYYEKNYFEIDYPLPKLDSIAIPDFSAGAMENWGLVTYREAYLLYDETQSTTSNMMTICSIVSHELAHMWFGNLVTMKWWDDLWLNEGFATFMSYKAVANVEPDWNYMDHFAIGELNRVFESDSTDKTHPILTNVGNADDISAVFDAITYAKGASVLRMLEMALGEENFRKGIKNYLIKYSYQNTLSADLYAELSEAHPERLNVSQIMDTWITKKGFPVVTITRTTGSNKITVRQELFLKDSPTSNSNYNWRIPLTYKAIGDQNIYTEWLNDNQKDIELSVNSDLIKFNVDQKGVFIVNYPPSDWQKWINGLNDNTSNLIKELTPIDRSELINDAFYLSRSGRLSYNIPLSLSKYLRYEDSLIPWTTAKSMFEFIKNLIYSDSDIALNQYMNDLVLNQYSSLGWDDSVGDANTRRLRGLIIDIACGYQMEDCLKTAAQKFADFKNGQAIAPNLLSFVLRYGIRQSNNSEDFYFLINKYNTTQSAQEKLQYLQGFTSTTDVSLLNELLTNASNEQFVRAQDFFTLLTYVAQNPNGLTLVWNYFRDNYEELERRFTINNSNLGRIVYTLSTYFTTESQKQEVLDFFKKYPNAGAGKLDREKATEVLDTNINWLNNYRNTVIEWVTNQCPNTTCLWNIYRLNQNIVPLQYYLTIQINTTTNVFNGTVEIEVNAKQEVDYFIVHAANILTVGLSQVYDNNTGREIQVIKTFRYLPLEFWVIGLGEKLTPNTYRLVINFESNLLLGGLVGLYKSYYEINNETIGLAATQFEATHARKAFPCFDEPSFRSQFDITVIHDTEKNLTLTNMPMKSFEDDSPSVGLTTTKYERSVSMVSYLVAILVSDFACRNDTTNEMGIDIRICASRVQEYKAQYALDVTTKIFRLFDNYLDSPYQLNKSDLVAIPHFSAGAMENWGLVKFRETALLWTEDEDTSASKMSVISIIAHELAHMWFGNLVTCNFWGDLWLNEGFASFMEYPAVNYSEPDWNYWDLFVYYDLSGAVSSDSSANSAPIVRQVLTPADMSYSSAIVYNKGATVIRMLEFAMGKDVFQSGIQLYLKQNSYTTAVTINLWNSLNQTFPTDINTNIYELMDSWTTKAGFPYINITRNADNSLTVTQERFLSNGQKPAIDTLWTVPLSYYTSFDTRSYKIEFLKSKQQTITVNTDQLPNGLIKFNVDYAGMYFVNYPLEDWDKWIQALVNNENNILDSLTPSDRTQFIMDSFYLSRANFLPYLKPFELSKYLVNETHFTPWAQFNSMFDSIRRYISMTDYKDSLNRYLSQLSETQYLRLGWNDTDGNDVTKRLRALIVEMSCSNDYEKCLEDANEEFNNWKQPRGMNLSPNLRGSVIRYGLRHSQLPYDFELIWNKYLSDNSSLKLTYLNALAYTRNLDLLKDLLKRSLDDRKVSVSDFITLMGYYASSTDGRPIVWDFYRKNYDMLTRKLSTSQIGSVLTTICGYFSDTTRRQEVQNFLNLNQNVGVTDNTRQSALNTIDSNIRWMNQYRDMIGNWLSTNGCGSEVCPWSVYRLNSNIIPIKYYPTIQVNVTTNIYNGSVSINVTAKEEVEYFIVHANSILNVTQCKVYDNNNAEIQITKAFRYKPYDFLVIQLAQKVQPNNYSLYYEFNGDLRLGGLSGLYRSQYYMDNKTIGLASTQFEFTDARKAFPCFDEPSFKSKFELTLIHDQHMNTTLSNMEVVDETTSDMNWVTTKYNETVPMVTYLVAIVVSDFVCKGSEIDGHKVGVCASPVNSNKLDYALDMTKSCLNHFAKVYLQVDYPLSKVDMIAIPDFNYGAMENWGLVTFRETALLWVPDEGTSANKMSVIAVIAHELAHFWFGNLVTCQWWSSLWLNEGFASFMEYTAVNASEPDWDYFELFLMSDYSSAVSADSSATSHPLIRIVDTPSQLEQYSSSIIYSKGATVIRMLEYVMTPNNFQTGIQFYLRNNSYSNAVTQNLLDSLNTAYPTNLDTNIYELMDSWTSKAGFPYLNITRTGNTLTITQERFLANGQKPVEDTLWTIPLSYYTSFDTREETLVFIKSKNETITINTDSSTNGLIKLNTDNKGMYFTNYPIEDWDKWISALVNNDNNILQKLTPSDRANFIIDSFYLSRANFLPYVKPLQLSKYLVNETHLTPWTIALNMFGQIQKYMLTTEYREQLLTYFTSLAKPIYDELGWNETQGSDTQKRLRANIIEFICSNYHEECLKSALQQYSNWKNGNDSKIPPNLLTSTLRYAIRQSNQKDDWDFLWDKYVNESSATIKLNYLNALSYTRDPILINTLLNSALDSKLVRTQDVVTILNYISANSDGLQIVWDFYRKNYQTLIGKLTTTQMGTVVNNICGYFTNNTRKSEVETFFNSNQNVGVTNSDRNRAIETINSNINWMNAHKDEVGNFLTCGSDSCPWTTYRLNSNIIPVKYDVTFEVDVNQNNFTGSVSIEVEAKEEVEYFIVHAANTLTISSSRVFINGTQTEIQVNNTFSYTPYEFWVIHLSQKQSANNYRLEFVFNSELNANMDGLYKSVYFKGNETIGLAATQFQSTSARKAFPCFDEPSFRSVFEVTIIHDSDLNLTISNMPIVSELLDSPGVGLTTHKYQETVPMVSYLLALVVSDFVCKEIEANDQNQYHLRVCASSVEEYKLDYSLGTTPQLLNHYENYFDYKYQLPKVDFIAIPDFSAGAMENWGLITFRETAMLWHEDESTSTNKMAVIAVIAHEIAHMWFGNLVTCHWWSDRWLNEAFASYMEYTAVNATEPDWDYWDLFIIFDYGTAISADSSSTSQPIVKPIDSPEQMAYTSAIIYQKGSSVLRMLEFVMTSNGFQSGLQQYLKKYEYSTVETINLWDELNLTFPTSLNTTIYELMDSWTTKAGFPYLNITRDSNNTLHITQERFLSNGQKPDIDTLWTVPLSYYTSFDTMNVNIEFIKSKEQSIDITIDQSTNGLIKLNTDCKGLFLVNYPEQDWDQWTQTLINNDNNIITKLTPSDRTNFIIDSFYLSRAGLLSYLKPLELSQYLSKETHLTPWTIAINMFEPLQRFLSLTEYKSDLELYLSNLAKPVYEELGWNDTIGTEVKKRLRSVIIEFICNNNYGPCLETAQENYYVWRVNKKLAPNILAPTLRYAIRHMNLTLYWNHLWDTYVNSTSTVLKLTYLNALSYTSNTDLIKVLLDRSLNESLVRKQDYVSVLNYIITNPNGLQIMWDYYRNNYSLLSQKLSASQLGSVVNNMCNYFSDDNRKKEVEEFFKNYLNVGVTSSERNRALETIDSNIKWMSDYRQEVGNWLKTQTLKSIGSETMNKWSKYKVKLIESKSL